MKIAFIGLGIMGSRMAANLLKQGYELSVYNRTKAAAEALQPMGAKVANSAQEAVPQADIVITMLSKPEVVEALASGQDGFLGNMQENSLWVDCSTVHPSFVRKMAEIAHSHKLRYLDAPVAGTKPHAENAELVFFVGGDQADLEEVRPLMDVMGRKVAHVGEISKGASLKMLVNAMLAQSMAIFAETMVLGEKMGLDKSFLLDFLPGLVVAAPFTKAKAAMIRANDYTVQFPLEHMQKDLQLASQCAYEVDQPLYMANMAKEIYAAAKADGLAREDFAAIYKYLAK